MISVNPSSFGRLTGADRRYPGGTEKLSIFFTLSREIPKWRAAARSLMPSRQARRTFRYSSTVKMPPPSLPPERAKVADFYAARSEPIPPLPWQTFAPPFPVVEGDPLDETRENFGFGVCLLTHPPSANWSLCRRPAPRLDKTDAGAYLPLALTAHECQPVRLP